MRLAERNEMSRAADQTRSSAARQRRHSDVSTDRVREFRGRKKRHALMIPWLEVPAGLPDALVEAGLLEEWDTEDVAEIRKAVEVVLKQLLE